MKPSARMSQLESQCATGPVFGCSASRYSRGDRTGLDPQCLSFASDFVERWFGVSPDGGNGTFGVMLIAAAAAVVVALFGLTKLTRLFQARSQGSLRTRA